MRRSRTPTPEIQDDINRVRQREAIEAEQDARNTRRFRWWQDDQTQRIQALLDELTESRAALRVWQRSVNEPDPPTGDYNALRNRIRSNWTNTNIINERTVRRMQRAYVREFGTDEDIFPYLEGLNLNFPLPNGRTAVDDIPESNIRDHQHGLPFRDLTYVTPQDGVNPLRENRMDWLPDGARYQGRELRARLRMMTRLGWNTLPEENTDQENIDPEDI